jgi:Zn-dependent peptidase ImmA (M78 family)
VTSHLPEILARKLSSRLFLKPPVDLEHVAAEIGLTIRTTNSTAYEGIMKRMRGRALGAIAVRGPLTNPRTRFTIAHEIGHYVLGRNDFLVSTCTRRDIRMYVRTKPEREIKANRFAAELLLPAGTNL